MQMAIDETIAISRMKNIIPNTLRFYRWKPPAVTIGYFQSLEKEVDVKKAEDLGIDIIRRYTGGGAVLHEHELTYSIVLSEDDLPKDIIKSYEKICGAIILGLKKLGIDSEFKPINDIVVDGKKISGNAQTRFGGIVLQHGTILMDVDIEKMFSVLKVPDEKIRDKMISAAKDRVTSIKHMGKEISYERLAEALTEGFEETFDVEFEQSEFFEEDTALQICKEKYATDRWNKQR
ncbi:lipoate--protein ligase family protein [Candidatus Woesearchaeota archaeon]|nr:lipoate--protein ligase family protein [Candidatus Woesearchaeota archaeon]